MYQHPPSQAPQARQTNYGHGPQRGGGRGGGSKKGGRAGSVAARYPALPMTSASAPAFVPVAPPSAFQQLPPAPPQVKPETDGVEEPRRPWTEEELKQAKANSEDFFDAPLNESGKRRVRVSVFNGFLGVDVREYFEGKYGDVQGKMLPSGRGLRLRLEEWAALKAASGDVDAAIDGVLRAPKPEAQ